TVRLWDAATGQESRTLGRAAACAAVCPTAPRVAVGKGNEILVLDGTGAEPTRVFKFADVPSPVAVSPAGDRLAAAFTARTPAADPSVRTTAYRVRVLDAATGAVVFDLGK